MSQNVELCLLSWEQFVDRFKPIKNPYTDSDAHDGTMFETFGKELEFVKKQPNEKVWTFLAEDDVTWISEGYHFVNRIGYFVTEVPAAPGAVYEIDFQRDEELED